nr:MAG TPA: hypothetical protein [Caudoviricetes sp.]
MSLLTPYVYKRISTASSWRCRGIVMNYLGGFYLLVCY